MELKDFDTIILGGGPAGLSSAVYAARGNVNTAVIDINMLGGQPSNYNEIENYIGLKRISGFELTEKFEEHADMFGVKKFPMQEIVKIDLISNPKVIMTKDYEFHSKTVIIATGAKPMKLGVDGEDKFIGRGVSYCAVCDAMFYKDKVVAVVGGGNSAVEEALYLTKFASKVYLIHRRNELRADKIIQERAFKNSKIEFLYDSVVTCIKGGDKVDSVVINNVKTNDETALKIDGIFIYIGITPNVEGINGQVEQNSSGFIMTDETMKTSLDGVYAVGDVRNTPLRQVVTAVSDGAIASVYAVKYIESLEKISV